MHACKQIEKSVIKDRVTLHRVGVIAVIVIIADDVSRCEHNSKCAQHSNNNFILLCIAVEQHTNLNWIIMLCAHSHTPDIDDTVDAVLQTYILILMYDCAAEKRHNPECTKWEVSPHLCETGMNMAKCGIQYLHHQTRNHLINIMHCLEC